MLSAMTEETTLAWVWGRSDPGESDDKTEKDDREVGR